MAVTTWIHQGADHAEAYTIPTITAQRTITKASPPANPTLAYMNLASGFVSPYRPT